jgi:hypothetical protein
MIFEPGHSYYVLTADEYSLLLEWLEGDGLSYFSGDFTQGTDADGNLYYFCDVSSGAIDADERQYLEDQGFLNVLQYIKSTQSTIWVGKP